MLVLRDVAIWRGANEYNYGNSLRQDTAPRLRRTLTCARPLAKPCRRERRCFPGPGEISPTSVFKSPLGHPEWWYITLFRAPLEHADAPAYACGLPTALTGPASRRGRQP